ncbi:MAG: hypothetical protein AAGA30_00935 [Planctomycetota bacterium]
MSDKSARPFFIADTGLSLLVPAIVIVPLFLESSPSEHILQNEIWWTIARTIAFATLVSITTVTVAFTVACSMFEVKTSFLRVCYALQMLPFLVGEATTTFIFKQILGSSSYLGQRLGGEAETILVIAGVLRVWQFGSFCAVIYWLRIRNIPKKLDDYSSAVSMRVSEKVSKVYLPACAPLLVITFLFCFSFSTLEHFRLTYLFRASLGTNTELLDQLFVRTYHSLAVVDPIYAKKVIYQQARTALLIGVPVFAAICFCIVSLINRIASATRSSLISRAFCCINSSVFRKALVYVAIISTFLPFVVLFITFQFPQDIRVTQFVTSLFLSALAAFLVTAIATLLSVAFRLAFLKRSAKMTFVLIALFTFWFSATLVPRIALYLVGSQFLSNIQFSVFSTELMWVVGHVVLLTPLLLAFIVGINTIVDSSELSYLDCYKSTAREIYIYSFFKRLKLEYWLTFLVASSLIWNESTWNRIMSDSVPAFVSVLEMSMSGKKSDLSSAWFYAVIGCLVGVFTNVAWIVVARYRKYDLGLD